MINSSFLFLISNNDIYSRTLPYVKKKKKHKAKRKIQREKKEKKEE